MNASAHEAPALRSTFVYELVGPAARSFALPLNLRVDPNLGISRDGVRLIETVFYRTIEAWGERDVALRELEDKRVKVMGLLAKIAQDEGDGFRPILWWRRRPTFRSGLAYMTLATSPDIGADAWFDLGAASLHLRHWPEQLGAEG